MDALKNSTTFCVLPFIHRHINPGGTRQLCCIAECFKDGNFEQNINETKRKMLHNEPVSQCSRCYESEKLGITSYRQSSYNQFSPIVDIDDISHAQVISFDYRDDVCNLTCASCGPDYSTAHKKINIKAISTNKKNNAIMANDIIEAIDSKALRHLYWAGGEPFKSTIHWQVMEHLSCAIDNDEMFNEQLNILYNTNMTQITFKNKNIPLFLKKFKHVTVSASLDGVGLVAEYTRNGADWPTLKANIEQFINVLGHERVSLSTVLSLPVILDIRNLLKFAEEHHLLIVSQPLIVNSNCQLMHPNVVELECLKLMIAKAVEEVKHSNISAFSKNHLIVDLNSFIKNYTPVQITDDINKNNSLAEQLRKSKNTILQIYDIIGSNIIFNK